MTLRSPSFSSLLRFEDPLPPFVASKSVASNASNS
jgi:hypothetical protein